MSRFMYGSLALGALAILLTDSDPALAPPKRAEAEVETGRLRTLSDARNSHMVVRVAPEPAPAEVAERLEVARPTPVVIPEPARVAVAPPPPPEPDPGSARLVSAWTTDQEASALDPEVQVKRIASDQDVEAVFVIDTTGSMGWIFDTARDKALELMKALEASRDEGKRARAALVDYKDRMRVRDSSGRTLGLDRERHLKVAPLTNDWGALRASFQAMHADGGGDLEEDTQGGLLAALDELEWSEGKGVTRLVYLIGDAPAKRYEDQPGLKALARRLADGGYMVHAFNASAEYHGHHERVAADWKLLAGETGGSYEVIHKPEDFEAPRVRKPHAVPVCRLPPARRKTPPSRGLDLWIGPGDGEPEVLDLDREDPVPTPTPVAPRRLGGLDLEVWSDI